MGAGRLAFAGEPVRLRRPLKSLRKAFRLWRYGSWLNTRGPNRPISLLAA